MLLLGAIGDKQRDPRTGDRSMAVGYAAGGDTGTNRSQQPGRQINGVGRDQRISLRADKQSSRAEKTLMNCSNEQPL